MWLVAAGNDISYETARFPFDFLQIPWSIANRQCLWGLVRKNFSAGKICLLHSLRRESGSIGKELSSAASW
jgi:hypothetical protein